MSSLPKIAGQVAFPLQCHIT